MDSGDTELISDSGGPERTDLIKPSDDGDPALENPEDGPPEDAAETLSIPTLNLFGILVLILLLGVCLSRIGRARS